MNNEKLIGIVGGVGPHAGLDLVRKIFNQTEAKSDQQHLPLALLSLPQEVEDRTAFLSGRTTNNPAYGIVKVITKLVAIGTSVVGIACNTAHAPQIFNVIVEETNKANIIVKLVNMIDEVSEFIRDNYADVKNIGILGTMGTFKTGIYETALKGEHFNVIVPNERFQQTVHDAIYDHELGIKAQSDPATKTAQLKLMEAIAHLKDRGAEAVILGCTEIPLAISENKINDILIIDPTLILARALIREVSPDKLKPFSNR
ncbi:MAG: aspartate/glutamate racemase family protein [bacterium]|nr:MAG: aspartate/glutamate racemase family protein [bacterium]